MKASLPRPLPAAENVDARTALSVIADLSRCDLDESAEIVHRWLDERQPHAAVAITTNGSRTLLSHWTSPSFDLPSGIDWSAEETPRQLGLPIVAAGAEAGESSATIFVVLGRRQAALRFGVDRALHALARVIAARLADSATGTCTAQLSLAHAVAAERDRLTRELEHHFGGQLENILAQLRVAEAEDLDSGAEAARTMASRALADLRERRPSWRQARRAEDAFAVLDRETGDLARAAGVRLECTLTGRADDLVGTAVLDTASWITRAAVRNVIGHADAGRARVDWSLSDEDLVVSVADDGHGFDPDREAGAGIHAMRRRAEALGGALVIDSVPGWGTRLRASLRLHAVNALRVDESASALVRTLGDRELDVLRLIAVGRRNRDIAEELDVSPHTVKFHLGNIFEKLGVRTRAEAAAVAFAAGIHPRTAPALVASGV